MSSLVTGLLTVLALLAFYTDPGSEKGSKGNLHIGLIGLGLSYVLPLTGLLSGFVNSGSELEQEMVAVERVGQYINKFSSTEEDIEASETCLSGDISFYCIWAKYPNTSSWALANCSLVIPQGNKVAICGRSGSGKSTFLNCLLGMLPVSRGAISIGLENIASLSRACLARQIGYMPQKPTMFSSSIKDNLDPEDAFTDSQLLHALQVTGLLEMLEKYGDSNDILRGLSNGNGINLSSVQQQMLSLSRIVLHKYKYICLDEPSSHLSDSEVCSIFSVIDRELERSTIVETVHQFSRAISVDFVAIMDEGRIIEQGHPHELLDQRDSIFQGMMMSTQRPI